MDALQLAIVAEIARRNGQERTAREFERKSEQAVRREIAENREWQRKLHGKER